MSLRDDARSELLQFLRQNQTSGAPAVNTDLSLVPDDGGNAAIGELVQYTQQLEAQEEKRANRAKWAFGSLGLFLLAMSAGVLGSMFWGDADPWIAFGFMALFAGGAFALGRLQSNPLEALHNRMKKLHASLVKPERRAQPKGMFKSRRDRIIAGVAGGLASRLGIKPNVLRLLFLLSIPFTGGATIPLYLLLAVGLSFLPTDEEKL